MNVQKLLMLTNELLECNQSALEAYRKARETGNAGDFYQEVKPFADHVKDLCDKWLPLAVHWVESEMPKHLHVVQLKNAAENIQMVSVRAFYPETSLKKFNSHVQSVDFVLNRLLDYLTTQ